MDVQSTQKINVRTKSVGFGRFLKVFALSFLVLFSVPPRSPSLVLAAEESPTEETQQLSKEEMVKVLRHRQDSMKRIYQDEKWNLKEDLRIRLQEIKDNREGPSAKREAVRQWKSDFRNLKAAYRQAWSENADEIAVLQGRTLRNRSGSIQMFDAPPSVATKSCSRTRKIKKRRCRRCR